MAASMPQVSCSFAVPSATTSSLRSIACKRDSSSTRRSVMAGKSTLDEARVDARQPLHVRALARVENVVERAEALGPAVEIAIELEQVAIVLEPFLKTVAREQLVEIAALDGIRNALEPPVPARSLVRDVLALAEQLA